MDLIFSNRFSIVILSAFIKRSLHAKTIVFYYEACNFYEDPKSYYFIITCIWQAQHSKREYFSVLSHDIFLYRRLCLYVHIQPGFERYVDAVIEYRDLLYQFPDKDVIYLISVCSTIYIEKNSFELSPILHLEKPIAKSA